MTHLKSYLGSIVLAGLLLQGCGSDSDSAQPLAGDTTPSDVTTPSNGANTPVASFEQLNAVSDILSSDLISSDDSAQALSDLTLKITALDASDSGIQAGIDAIIAENDEITTRAEAYAALAASIVSPDSTASNAPRRNVLDTLKDGLVNVFDSSAGDKITSAAFDVVLNSDGVTVAMIDMARGSNTISEIMVNALEANWGLTEKMCPMLRENTEFGEKFTALAEEKDIIGRFFFERIDANMYGCLTDAMLLSNDDAVHDASVAHSTNGYMGLLMNRYAADYFIMPTNSTEDRRNDKFVSLLLNTGAIATYDSETKTFTGHGDGNELTNEKFFYSLFKTPDTTNAFVDAMKQVDPATKKMLMDNIFLGQPAGEGEVDTLQGALNIIAIGSSMYDGIYGAQDHEAYGMSSYFGAFIGFATLIPGDRFMTYGKAFVNAGYKYAEFHGIDVWSGVSDTVAQWWNSDDETTVADANITEQAGSPARSGGNGFIDSAWTSDTTDLLLTAWDNFDLVGSIDLEGLYDYYINDVNTSSTGSFGAEADKAYATIIDGRDADGNKVYATTVETGEAVYGFHGLLELATQEDIYNVNHESNESYTMEDAKAAFTLPAFADINMSFVYNSAKDGAMAYSTNIDAEWFANLSNNDLIREYFYPSADNAYIPSWMLAIDWLKAPDTLNNTNLATTDFDYNAGYFDVYVTSTNDNILVAGSELDITVALSSIKDMEVSKVDMGSDSVIAVDENGQTLDQLYVYKIRTISPEDTQAVLDYLGGLGDSALSAVGIDSSNASTVDTTDAEIVNTDSTTAE